VAPDRVVAGAVNPLARAAARLAAARLRQEGAGRAEQIVQAAADRAEGLVEAARRAGADRVSQAAPVSP
jgi:hypothetical protein